MTDRQNSYKKSSNIDVKMDGIHKPKKNNKEKRTPERYKDLKGNPIE